MPAEIFAFCNQKGGVGKTTTVFHLAYAAAQAGRRALVVDIDPQGNVSTVLAKLQLERDDIGVADVLSESSKATIADAVVPTVWPGVDLVPTVPGNESLAYVRDQLVIAGAGRERRLRDALDLVRGVYDVVLIDCPPSLDLLTINALVAARIAVVVTQSALFSANGLARLRRTIDAVKRSYNPDLDMFGAIVNLHEIGTISGREQLVEIASSINVLGDTVPKRVVIKDSMEAQTSLVDWGTTQSRSLSTIYRDTLALLVNGQL
ncbi:cobalamin biosynthesis protein CobQ [Rhodococcus sp. 06-156-3C]|uniref:ParA family protein n=1 Tax=Nocardiaceae TaxID=85025 RepID=UPI000522EAAF|nr:MULTISPECIES: AAA family ATPase [Rhodococcus]OZD13000.1 cobalamin biosynthesis protein CobQ [Rhodococcus sp. 06-156-4a]OZD17868.1 cobalamin biosynthesis protein CobQ [Rhodococcus sp. 06-156-3C]OZD20594.1 cobalamin biosynthesis protein CobQ [Rhodococcus sp. 06-156-4C]OZD30687.1 cobalamin biosynthesis protein CobQ [Rhodococcus sp. 06-156-3b]OZD32538.1 cobalamin biosynthesis protein CobQ [Rhodococcus sp. 06-156-3]